MRVVIAKNSARNHAAWRWPDWVTERLRERFPVVDFRDFTMDADERFDPARPPAGAEVFHVAEAAIAWRLPAALVAAAPRLRWVHAPSSAVHELLIPELVGRGVTITHGAAVHAPAVVEHGLALLFALARQIPRAVRLQSRAAWDQSVFVPQPGSMDELAGATALMVGLGHIGSALALRLDALGMEVLGVRRHAARPAPGCREVHSPEALADLLPRADYVILAAPVTAATQALIGAPQFARMKAGARLINLARGALVDESALASALAAGQIAGAALDVFEQEPLPPDSPLWHCDRVLLTPHVAGVTPHTWSRQLSLVTENLRRFLAAEPLLDVVDPTLGY